MDPTTNTSDSTSPPIPSIPITTETESTITPPKPIPPPKLHSICVTAHAPASTLKPINETLEIDVENPTAATPSPTEAPKGTRAGDVKESVEHRRPSVVAAQVGEEVEGQDSTTGDKAIGENGREMGERPCKIRSKPDVPVRKDSLLTHRQSVRERGADAMMQEKTGEIPSSAFAGDHERR